MLTNAPPPRKRCLCSRVALCPACYREQECEDAGRRMREVLRTFGTRPTSRPLQRRLRLVPRPGTGAA